MNKKPFEATSLRKVLIFLMVVVVGGAVGVFYLGLDEIRSYALEVTHTTEDASASSAQVDQLKTLKDQLAQTQSLVGKANNLYATETTYQAQAVKDLQKYAGESGVSITNTDFSQTAVSDPSFRNVKITVAQPVSYASLQRFLQLIEGSLPKMQVQELTVSRPQQPNGDAVNVNDITIRIAVK